MYWWHNSNDETETHCFTFTSIDMWILDFQITQKTSQELESNQNHMGMSSTKQQHSQKKKTPQGVIKVRRETITRQWKWKIGHNKEIQTSPNSMCKDYGREGERASNLQDTREW